MVFISTNVRIFMNFGVKPQKQKVFIAKSTEKPLLFTNSGVTTSILGVSGLELHSSSTKPVNFFGGTVLSWGGHNHRLGGTSSDLGGTAPECPLWRWACMCILHLQLNMQFCTCHLAYLVKYVIWYVPFCIFS